MQWQARALVEILSAPNQQVLYFTISLPIYQKPYQYEIVNWYSYAILEDYQTLQNYVVELMNIV